MGKVVAYLLGAEKLSSTSNEVRWQGKRAVIKACAPTNTSFGITVTMLERLDEALLAAERDDGTIIVTALSIQRFTDTMRDSRSGGSMGRVKLVTRQFAEREGRRVARFSKEQVQEADAATISGSD